MTIGVGIAGFGLAGRYLHAPLIVAAGMDIRAVCSSRVDAIEADFPAAQAIDEFDALIARDDVDLIVVATPNDLHHPQAKAALQAGKHVVIDKPFVLDTRQADDLIETAEGVGRKLSVYHNRRWDADILTMRKLMADQRLGDVSLFDARWDRMRPQVQDRWREVERPGAGLLYDLGSHMLDQALQFFGMPNWLQADIFVQRAGATVDDGFEILMGAGRLRIRLGASSMVVSSAARYQLHGERGSYVKSGVDVQEAQLRAGQSPDAVEFGVEPEAQSGVFTDVDGRSMPVRSERGAWLTFYRQMKAAVAGDAPVPVEPRSARDVVGLIEAVRLSADERKRVDLKYFPAFC